MFNSDNFCIVFVAVSTIVFLKNYLLNWTEQEYIPKIGEFFNTNFIKILRVPLWIGHDSLLLEGNLKLRSGFLDFKKNLSEKYVVVNLVTPHTPSWHGVKYLNPKSTELSLRGKFLRTNQPKPGPSLPLLQPPYLVLPPTAADQPAGPRIKKWREGETSQLCISPQRVKDEEIRQLPTVVGWTILDQQPDCQSTAEMWLDLISSYA